MEVPRASVGPSLCNSDEFCQTSLQRGRSNSRFQQCLGGPVSVLPGQGRTSPNSPGLASVVGEEQQLPGVPVFSLCELQSALLPDEWVPFHTQTCPVHLLPAPCSSGYGLPQGRESFSSMGRGWTLSRTKPSFFPLVSFLPFDFAYRIFWEAAFILSNFCPSFHTWGLQGKPPSRV